jgi:hypothetical protein
VDSGAFSELNNSQKLKIQGIFMRFINTQPQALNGMKLEWKYNLGSVQAGTKRKYADIFTQILGNNGQDNLRCLRNDDQITVNFDIEKMVSCELLPNVDPFLHAITLKFLNNGAGKKVLGVGVQYAVEPANGARFRALLRTTNNNGIQNTNNNDGRTINITQSPSTAVFLGAIADPGESIQSVEFTVEQTTDNISAFYINSPILLIA